LQITAIVCMFANAASPASAEAFSQWDSDTRSAVRLLLARPRIDAGNTVLRAGVEIKLQPNWITYGRDPGNSGVPPVFDFGGSVNVKTVTVLWPTPERFSDGAGYSMGYKNGIVLPLHVVPRDLKKPVMLRLNFDYAVCDKICVPVKAKVELALAGAGNATSEALIAAAEARVVPESTPPAQPPRWELPQSTPPAQLPR
jgi:DsbC/DsbD-like thiol-disulfide interchange protein